MEKTNLNSDHISDYSSIDITLGSSANNPTTESISDVDSESPQESSEGDFTSLENYINYVESISSQLETPDNSVDPIQLIELSNRLKQYGDIAKKSLDAIRSELLKTKDLLRLNPLTKLLNRKGLEDAFNREVAIQRRVERGAKLSSDASLVFIDIDKFKSVNDRHGHDIGDQVIIHVAKIIRETVRANDIVAHLHGDEFVVVFTSTPEEGAEIAFAKIQRALELNPFYLGQTKIETSISGGITSYRHGSSLEETLQIADQKMAHNKNSTNRR